MHAIQTSGNCIRNVTADHFAGAAADEIEDPRPTAELLRQWSTDHPEFQFLPRKFKIAITGAERPRGDQGARYRPADGAQRGRRDRLRGRSSAAARAHADDRQGDLRDFLPKADLLPYLEAVVQVYNLSAGATTSTRRASRSSCTSTGSTKIRARSRKRFARQKRELLRPRRRSWSRDRGRFRAAHLRQYAVARLRGGARARRSGVPRLERTPTSPSTRTRPTIVVTCR
jgi:sulfite reductase (NADPH) hemoprotein beta-component